MLLSQYKYEREMKYTGYNIIMIVKNKTQKTAHERSPLSLRAKARSFGWIVTRLAWIAAKFVSSNSETR